MKFRYHDNGEGRCEYCAAEIDLKGHGAHFEGCPRKDEERLIDGIDFDRLITEQAE
jgi:hypothetical protein